MTEIAYIIQRTKRTANTIDEIHCRDYEKYSHFLNDVKRIVHNYKVLYSSQRIECAIYSSHKPTRGYKKK